VRRLMRRPGRVPVMRLPFEAHVHPLLVEWLRDSSAAKVETLLVTYRDSLAIPRFPSYDAARPLTDPVNLAIRATADSLAALLTSARSPMHDSMTTKITARGGNVIHSYYLAQIQLVTLRLGDVHWLVDTLSALYVQPKNGRERPPDGPDSEPANDPMAARAAMSSEPYVPFSPQYGHAGLLDTGVYADHELFAGTGRLLRCWDCVKPDGECVETTTWKDPFDHGTASAAILSGGTDRTDPHTGVTEAGLNVYQVYSDATSYGALDAAAAVAALELAATVNLDAVMLAEMDGQVSTLSGGLTLSEWNGITQMAERAYQAGRVVVAANGDWGGGKVAAPAVGRGVIGVGAIDVVEGTRYSRQSYGPTADLRCKPDVQAYTNTETADNSGPKGYSPFPGTSGSSPYAAGGAVLLRNWLVQAAGGSESSIDAGQVYAQMILAGQSTASPDAAGAFVFDPTAGAGLEVLPTNGYCWFGKVDVTPGEERTIDLNVSGTDATKMEAALWWEEPELADYSTAGASDVSNLELWLAAPDGVETKSMVANGVFERLTSDNGGKTLPAGHWTLHVKNVSDSAGPVVTAYWTVAYRR
jgi:serine protease AprX